MDGGWSQVNPETTQVDDLQLVALPTAVNCAELFVRFALTEWSLKVLLDDAADVARDLVSAAVDVADQKAPTLITVRLRLHHDCLVIEVESAATSAPTAGSSSPDGRRTGVVDLGPRGQLAWYELPLPGGMNASAVPLPRRQHRRSAEADRQQKLEELSQASDVDADVMRRILFGLNRPQDGAGGHSL
jgi:hypothetical protein